MRRKNLYYAQLGEALKFAQSNIFEYKRISLILFDNIIENILITQNTMKLHHLLVMSKIQKKKYQKILNSFNRFEKTTYQSFKLGLIKESEKNIIDYCHKTRNNLYHNLFADKRVTDFCIHYYCDFLEQNFQNFIEIDITGYSGNESRSTKEILRIEKVEELSGIIFNLKEYNHTQKKTPQLILLNIIKDYIWKILDTMENETFKNYDELNNVAKEYYNDYYKNKKYDGLNPSGFIKQWYFICESKINAMENQISELQKISIEKSFRKFHNIMLKIEPIYIGIMLYYSEQEYLASLNED